MLRLGRSAQLLENRAGNVSEVAYMVGFRDADYFAKLFKQAYSVSPSSYPKVADA
jgi:AraC-like DNA-binding protein